MVLCYLMDHYIIVNGSLHYCTACVVIVKQFRGFIDNNPGGGLMILFRNSVPKFQRPPNDSKLPKKEGIQL